MYSNKDLLTPAPSLGPIEMMKFIQWILSGLIGFLAFGSLLVGSAILSFILFVIAFIAVFPPLQPWIESKAQFFRPRFLKVVAAIVFFIAATLALPNIPSIGLTFSQQPEATVSQPAVTFAGTIEGEKPTLTANDQPVPVANKQFEYQYPLKPGDNRIVFKLRAYKQLTDKEPSETEQEFKVLLADKATLEKLDAAKNWDSSSGGSSLQTQRCFTNSFSDETYKGRCKGTYSKLQGSTFLEIEPVGSAQSGGYPIRVSFVSVGTGRVRVSIKQPDDTIKQVEAGPGESILLEGIAAKSSFTDEVKIKFESLDGESKEIEYEVKF